MSPHTKFFTPDFFGSFTAHLHHPENTPVSHSTETTNSILSRSPLLLQNQYSPVRIKNTWEHFELPGNQKSSVNCEVESQWMEITSYRFYQIPAGYVKLVSWVMEAEWKPQTLNNLQTVFLGPITVLLSGHCYCRKMCHLGL